MVMAFFFAFLFFSCNKEEATETTIPEWFWPAIEELEKSGDCYGCSITQITYEKCTYYNLYCGFWSCMYCNLFDSEGNHINWETEEFNKFLSEKKDERIIWECKQ